jgi:hypothetical protein
VGLASAVVVAALGFGSAAPAGASTIAGDDRPGDRFPLFDYTDAFYQRNGIDPADIVGRRNGTDGLSVVDKSPDRNHRDVRVLFTLPGYDHSGDTVFFTVMGDLAPDPFTNDKAGRDARKLAEASPVYVFPTRAGDPLGVGNSRQADLVDMRHGYFSNNPLGIWVHVFVSYTDKAFNTPAGRKMLADLADRNGLDLDGTPIIATTSELDSLKSKGLVALQKRPQTEQGRYFLCPAFKDPRDGGITSDAFLVNVKREDGTALPAEQHFVDDFESLRDTGDWS